MLELTDDGTLDTVLRCSDCGAEMRYNYDGADIDAETSAGSYDSFVEWAIEDATDEHVCYPCESCGEPSGEGNQMCPACKENNQ